MKLDAHAFRLRAVGAEDMYTPEQLTGALEALLGDGARIVIDNVADIPAEANGKFRVLVPLAHADVMDGEPSSPAEQTNDGTTQG